MYSTNCILIIDIQYWVSMYYCLHSRVLLPLKFWSTTIHSIWVRVDAALSNACASGRQFALCTSFHLFFVNIVRHPHLSLSSAFSLISIMYHMQFEISQPCTRGLGGELCTWVYAWIWHGGLRSDRFVKSTDDSFHHMYNIIHFNFVSIIHH